MSLTRTRVSQKRFTARDILGQERFIFADNLEEARDEAEEEYGPFTCVLEEEDK